MTYSLYAILSFASFLSFFGHIFLMMYALDEKCVVYLVLFEFQNEEKCIKDVA